MAERRRRRRRFWTAAEIRTLRELYPTTPTKRLAWILRRPLSSVYQCAIKLGLRKSAAYLASPAACRLRRGDNVGAASRYRKGNVPFNKGKKGWNAGGRSIATRFKKGHMVGAAQRRWVPIGTEVVDQDGYRKRKVSDDRTVPSRRNWRFVHVLLWESVHGSVPAGHAVCFLNGNRADIRIENLELVHRCDLMRRNTLHNYPKPIARLIQLRGALNRQINKRSAQR